MCPTMAEIVQKQKQEVVPLPANLGKQLAVAVRSIKWSYAIFWSSSPTQQGVLEWWDGCYNGDIKTRKSVQEAVELRADKTGLQRSEQLRELYESLQESETDTTKRPSAALSPEDLSDEEWYYLVCMSFVFNPGQCLPGRSLANRETIWLCNAQYADREVFNRSLLAKSACIQTVVCFPHLGGVVEVGVTEMVPEDFNLLQHIKTSLLDFSKPFCVMKSLPCSNHTNDDDKDPLYAEVNSEILDVPDLENSYSLLKETRFDKEGSIGVQVSIADEINISSPHKCSCGFENDKNTEVSFVLETVADDYSQPQKSKLLDDNIRNGDGIAQPISSGDCTSIAIVHNDGAGIFSSASGSLSYLDLETKSYFYFTRTLSAILESSAGSKGPCFNFSSNKSSFVSWTEGDGDKSRKPQLHQNILQKILITVPQMHAGRSFKSWRNTSENRHCSGELENAGSGVENTLPDKTIGDNMYQVLRSIVPSVWEVDEASLLTDTIKYLKELEARVEELESCMELVDYESRPRRNYLVMMEETSDNYDSRKVGTPYSNKRKAFEVEESHATDPDETVLKEGHLKVSITGQELLIQMRCHYREFILLDIMDAINNLHLDAHTVESSTVDGVLILTLRSKFCGAAAVAPAGMIRQALLRVAGRC